MRNLLLIFAITGLATAPPANGALSNRAPQATAAGNRVPTGQSQTIDGIAVRIDNDIIMESEIRELGAFQTLVDGKPQKREEVVRELEDQWILRSEAETARFGEPSEADIDNAYKHLSGQFPSQGEFTKRCSEVGLSEDAVRRQLKAQLYLSRFLDFRFRPAAQIEDAAIQQYYDQEFVPELKKRGAEVPPLAKVQDTIREVLVQRTIDSRSTQWLDDTRTHLRIDVIPTRAKP